jgi:2-polyprenyl-3-methyl-5-hydroxy-6-metoxy-1,4-benzoquinol methylase
LREAREVWDQWAVRFDDEADHGLRESNVRAEWGELLLKLLPTESASVLDLGCGTGSLSILAAQAGHSVNGIDCSPEMTRIAEDKAKQLGLKIQFDVGDAANPQVGDSKCEVILCRHVLWTLPEPEMVLKRWTDLVSETGRLILIEGYWGKAGLRAKRLLQMIPAQFTKIEHVNLSENSVLWGKSVSDERYAVKAMR